MFNIRDYADFVTINLENDTTIKLMYYNDSTYNERLFNGKMTNKYFEIYFSKKSFLIPLIFSSNDIDRIRIGISKERKLLIRNFINLSGNILFFGGGMEYEDPYMFDRIYKYKNLIPAKLNDKWGYADSAGNLVIPNIYDFTRIFEKDVAGVKFEGKWGLINKYGETIIPFKYDWISLMDTLSQPHICMAYKDEKVGVFDISGKEIIPVIYDEIKFYFERIIIRLNDKYGIATRSSGIVIPAIYSKIWYMQTMRNGGILVKRNEKYYAVDMDGYEYDTRGIGIMRDLIKSSKRKITQ
jgi:hypothetical protein